MGAKAIATILGGLCFVIAIAINSTGTEKFGMAQLKETVNVTFTSGSSTASAIADIEVYVGVWLERSIVKVGSDTEENDPSPASCDQDQDSGGCDAGKDSDCCKSLAARCKTYKAFAVLAAVFSLFGTIAGTKSKIGGVVLAALTAFSFLIVFSLFASILEGEARSDGGPNKDADCGSKNNLFQGQTINFDYSAGFGIAVVGSFLSLVQAGLYFAESDGYIA